MCVPVANSKQYKSIGRTKAVFNNGLVVFLTPNEYNLIMPHNNAIGTRDATPEEVQAHDETYNKMHTMIELEWDALIKEATRVIGDSFNDS